MKNVILVVLTFVLIQCKPSDKKEKTMNEPTNKIKLSSEINWEPLNPARGDNSPKAGTIWGDRKGTVATGFLAKFKDGFSSPPHIHNVSYRAFVISGEIHNDDADAEKMWMPAGSFWTQPAGAAHITAAKGSENIAYVEIDHGPYLVKPIDEAFDNGERPVNIDPSNMVWLGADKTTVIEKTQGVNNEAKVTFLWEKDGLQGVLIKLPKGFKGILKSSGTIFRGIVIQGKPTYEIPNSKTSKTLDAGSSFSSEGESIHQIASGIEKENIIYVRTNNKFSLKAI